MQADRLVSMSSPPAICNDLGTIISDLLFVRHDMGTPANS
jgi:hypothetical protein